MVTDIEFTIIENGEEMNAILSNDQTYDLEALADILTGMFVMETDKDRYESAKRMIIHGCKNLMKSI